MKTLRYALDLRTPNGVPIDAIILRAIVADPLPRPLGALLSTGTALVLLPLTVTSTVMGRILAD